MHCAPPRPHLLPLLSLSAKASIPHHPSWPRCLSGLHFPLLAFSSTIFTVPSRTNIRSREKKKVLLIFKKGRGREKKTARLPHYSSSLPRPAIFLPRAFSLFLAILSSLFLIRLFFFFGNRFVYSLSYFRLSVPKQGASFFSSFLTKPNQNAVSRS
jgi:hypothetical protein